MLWAMRSELTSTRASELTCGGDEPPTTQGVSHLTGHIRMGGREVSPRGLDQPAIAKGS